jgi:hypothetical protein
MRERDVIARASLKAHRVAYEHEWTEPELDRYHGDAADAILAALHEAGYEIVPRTDGPWEWRKARGVLKHLKPGVPSEQLIRELYEDDPNPNT